MTPRPPALIFDFGNVVAFFDYARACETYGCQLGQSPQEFLATLRRRGLDAVVRSYESGEIPTEEFTRTVVGLTGLDIAEDEFAAAWTDIFWINQPVADLVARLKAKGHTLVLGSNTNALHAGHFKPLFAETLRHFDRLVLSYEVGYVKPSAAFYLACAEAAGAPPGGCVFIDDLPENVEGARQAGLQALLFRDVAGLVEDLRGLGVQVGPPEV